MLQLDTYFFIKTNIEALPHNAIKSSIVQPDVKVAANHESENRYHVALEISTNSELEKIIGYHLDLHVMGLFHWDDAGSMTQEDIERNVVMQGASLLYTCSREYIANITSRGPHNTLFLATKTFYNLKRNDNGGNTETPKPQKRSRKSK